MMTQLFILLLALSLPTRVIHSQEDLSAIRSQQACLPEGDLKHISYVQQLIHTMSQLDQQARSAWSAHKRSENQDQLLADIDRFHTDKMKQILAIHGWVKISKFGAPTDHEAWLLVQHADHDPCFQAGCLIILSHLVPQGETDAKNFAYLYDRVAGHFSTLGMKQRYGTQVRFSPQGEASLQPYEGTLMEVNQRRAQLGLETVEHYLATISNIYQHDIIS